VEVDNFGGFTRQFRLNLDPPELLRYGLGINDVINAINNNANAGGGRVARGDQGRSAVVFEVRGLRVRWRAASRNASPGGRAPSLGAAERHLVFAKRAAQEELKRMDVEIEFPGHKVGGLSVGKCGCSLDRARDTALNRDKDACILAGISRTVKMGHRGVSREAE
jgi:multidrug efflux pump subunit AcrB